jgi:hypothetical protein
MTPARLNLICAALAFVGSLILAAFGIVSAFIWLAASLVWLILALSRRRTLATVDSPGRKIARRLSRLLLFS